MSITIVQVFIKKVNLFTIKYEKEAVSPLKMEFNNLNKITRLKYKL